MYTYYNYLPWFNRIWNQRKPYLRKFEFILFLQAYCLIGSYTISQRIMIRWLMMAFSQWKPRNVNVGSVLWETESWLFSYSSYKIAVLSLFLASEILLNKNLFALWTPFGIPMNFKMYWRFAWALQTLAFLLKLIIEFRLNLPCWWNNDVPVKKTGYINSWIHFTSDWRDSALPMTYSYTKK